MGSCEETPSTVEIATPCLAVFFIVLPDAVPLPDGATWTASTDEREPSLDGVDIRPVTQATSFSQEEGTNFVSLQFLQVDDNLPSSLEADRLILSKAIDRIVRSEVEGELEYDRGPERYRTVVEMVTYVAKDDDWIATELKPDPLTRCLNSLYEFHRAYRIQSHLPCEALTYKRLHPFVLCARRGLSDGRTVMTNVMVLDIRPNHIGSFRNDIGTVNFDEVSIAQARLRAGDPTVAFRERMVDADYKFHQLGKNSEAVVEAAIGCEILMDGCLAMALWEEGTTEREAAEVFSTDLTPRVKNSLPKALGGCWSLSTGPVGEWYEAVAGLRNRVVHAGYRPNDGEVYRCLAAVDGLARHLLDCVHGKAHKYPATAWTFLGVPGYENRGGVTRRARKWQHDHDLVSSIRDYSKWRDAVHYRVQRRRKSA